MANRFTQFMDTCKRNRRNVALSIVAIIWAEYCLYSALNFRLKLNLPAATTSAGWALLLVGTWVVGPPVLFYLGYISEDPDTRRVDPVGLELARNVWAGMTALLVLVALGKEP